MEIWTFGYTRTQYGAHFDRIVVNGAATYRNAEWGDCTIGGDHGDLEISSVYKQYYPGGDNVELINVHLTTTLEPDADTAAEIVEEIIAAAWDSIGSDAFSGKRRY